MKKLKEKDPIDFELLVVLFFWRGGGALVRCWEETVLFFFLAYGFDGDGWEATVKGAST
jgi:hypothetical protein